MFPSKALLSLILIATLTVTTGAASIGRRTGKATLSFATRINARGTLNIAEKDRARAQSKKQGNQLGKRGASDVSATNSGVSYLVEVGVGQPATTYTLLIDTGSANTWVGADKPYVQTGTSQDMGDGVSVTYGSGGFSGKEWTDTVTLGDGLVINQQSIGVASSSTGMSPGDDGILGVGPVDLTGGTVSGGKPFPTVLDNLYAQGTIPEETLGVYFTPQPSSSGGELTFGGYDESVTVGPMIYVPLTTTSPASQYWGIDQSIRYGSDTILSSTAGIVDTGSTLVLIATDAFQRYKDLTGAVEDSNTGLLKITSEQFDRLQPLEFIVGDVVDVPLTLTPNAQIWPRSLNTNIGGTPDGIYLIVGDIGTPSGSGLDFINGYTFLERYYSVYDATNSRVGLAFTEHTFSEPN